MKYVGLVVGLFALLFSMIVVGSGVGFNNSCVRQEVGIKAQYEQNQNNYDNYFKTVKESAQVPEMYTESLKKIYDSAIKGRYGNESQHLLFKFVQEHNPTVDSAVFTKLQQTIEAGRRNFEVDQKSLIEKKRVYDQSLGQFPGSLFAHFLGYPRIDLAKYGIVTSDETQAAFAAKRSAPIKLKD